MNSFLRNYTIARIRHIVKVGATPVTVKSYKPNLGLKPNNYRFYLKKKKTQLRNTDSEILAKVTILYMRGLAFTNFIANLHALLPRI